MKLELVHFKCHEKKTVEFEDSSMTLLTGNSGIGKSSILDALFFVLFGTGTKIVTIGKRKCKVVLHYNDLVITRSKGPNRLHLCKGENGEKEYEDQAAQSIIDTTFGSQFKTTSYLSQNQKQSFITMKPVEKAQFLTKFIFKDINLVGIKETIKKLTSTNKVELIKAVSKLEQAKQTSEYQPKPAFMERPLLYEQDLDKQKEQLDRENHTIDSYIVQSRNKMSLVRTAVNTNMMLDNQWTKLVGELKVAKQELVSIPIVQSETIKSYEKTIRLFDTNKRQIELRKRYNFNTTRLKKLIHDEKENMQTELGRITTKLQQIPHTMDQLKRIQRDLKIIRDLTTIANSSCQIVTKKQLDDLVSKRENYLHAISHQDKLSCPACESVLVLVDGSLHKHTINQDTQQLTLTVLKQELKALVVKIDSYTKLHWKYNQHQSNKQQAQTQLLQYPKYKHTLPDIQKNIIQKTTLLHEKTGWTKKYANQQQGIWPSVISQLQKENDTLHETISSNKTIYVDETIDINELRKCVSTLVQQKFQYDEKLRHIKQIVTKQSFVLSQKKVLTYSVHDCEQEYQMLLKKQKLMSTRVQELYRNINLNEKYSRFMDETKQYEKIVHSVQHLESENKTQAEKHCASLRLTNIITESESIAMVEIINSINKYTKIWLDLFFPTDPITIQLRTQKDVRKKTVPKIHLYVQYKNNECDVNMLSGGELCRVILAFTLAFSDLCENPLLLLDECTANLDEDSTSDVLEAIRDSCKHKTVIVVAHQVVVGQFSHHISL